MTCFAGVRTIPHAVSAMAANSYEYDCNGNQTTHNVGGQNYGLGYNAENRLVSVTGPNLTASFTYNGDGQRVKSVVNGETILFAGGHFELNDTTDEVTKYIFAGASRIAVRKYIVPETTTLNYMLGDHLGSTSVVTDTSGALVVETRYKPWGEVRFATANETLPTRYTFTGQYSYVSDEATDLGNAGFGLLFYNARWYDPYLNRFIQPDSIVPDPYNSQDWDRYSYARNNPIRFNDPTGHNIDCGIGDQYCDDLHQEYYTSWLPLAPNTSFDTYLIAKDSYYYYNSHPDAAVVDAFGLDGSGKEKESYMWARIYSENIEHSFFQPFGDDVTLRAIDQARVSGNAPLYWSLIFGLGILEWMDSDDKGGGGGNWTTGRTTARNLQEQLAMEAVMADPSIGRVIPITMTDPRWPASTGWVKIT